MITRLVGTLMVTLGWGAIATLLGPPFGVLVGFAGGFVIGTLGGMWALDAEGLWY